MTRLLPWRRAALDTELSLEKVGEEYERNEDRVLTTRGSVLAVLAIVCTLEGGS